MKLGVDLSTYNELEPLHPHYTYNGQEIEPFSFFASHSSISIVRLRLWHNPFDEEGNSYGGGGNDLSCFLALAKKANENGMDVLLDFHFSDFWVDPGRQLLPKEWKNLSYTEIIDAIYDYVKSTLLKAKKEHIRIAGIQVGNETTNGMVFPFGNAWNEYKEGEGGGFEGFASLFKSASKACREIYPESKILLHLEHPCSYDLQDAVISGLLSHGAEFDAIGESYYPYWHGPLQELEDSLNRLFEKYKKPFWLVELGYEFAPSRIEGHHCEYADTPGDLFKEGNIYGRVPFSTTPEGQANYLKLLLQIAKRSHVEYACYWEPAWIHIDGNGWAKSPGMLYCGQEITPAFNDWENATLFDFEGKATKAIDVFTQKFVDSL